MFFLAFDIPFFVANAAKFLHGGYVPVLIGSVFLVGMVVWRRGRRMLTDSLAAKTMPIDAFVATYCNASGPPHPHVKTRLEGACVVMASHAEGVPEVLAHHVERLGVFHETIILLTIVTARVPYVAEARRAAVSDLGGGFHRVIGTYGFMESPDVPALLRQATRQGLPLDVGAVTYFLGRETMLAGSGGQMGQVEEGVFAFLTRNSRPATAHFKLPAGQVIEIGMQIDL